MTSEEKTNYICTSPLTWERLEQDLQKAFNTKAKFGDNREAKPIGVGAGYVAKIFLATLDWVDGDDSLPKEVALKISGEAGICETVFMKDYETMKLKISQVHDIEMAFYDMVKNGWGVKPADFHIPDYYCGIKFGEIGVDFGYIAIEYAPGIIRHMYHNIDPEAVCEALKVYAKIQAKAEQHPDLLEKFKTSTLKDFTRDFLNEEALRAGLPSVLQFVPEMAPHLEKITPRIELLTNSDHFEKVVDQCYPNYFCHGDFWTANMIWTQDADSKYHISKVIDWQICHVGTPINDLIRLLWCATDSKTRKENFHRFMHAYYDTLVEELGDVKPKFNYDQLVESYERLLPLMNIPFIPFYGPMSQMIYASLEGEELEKAKEVFNDKVKGVMLESVEFLEKYY